jgi:hypothetical protein
LCSMIYYLGWVFYVSEPKYINNCYKKIEVYDYVSVPRYSYGNSLDNGAEVENGIVLQVDSVNFLVKTHRYSDEFRQLSMKNSRYRIVGKGTIYHKVNQYVGFNIMLITQFIIGILIAVLAFTVSSILKELLED